MWKNTWLKELAGKYGLEKGKSLIVEERSLLKDYTQNVEKGKETIKHKQFKT